MAPSAMRTNVDGCPDLEAIAAYLDGRLNEDERADVAAHVADCETCYFVFTEAVQTRISDVPHGGEPKPAAPAPTRTSRAVLWSSLAGLAVAALLLIVINVRRSGGGDSAELQALVAAVGTDRTIEPRLTGGFAFGPVRAATRGGNAASLSPDVRIAIARIEKAAAANRTPQNLRALGAAFLVSHEFDRAVATLEDASATATADARVLSDAAAAYLARSIATGERQDLIRALAAAERAVGADPKLPEAWFNRAEVLEHMGSRDQAREAWREYLAIDADSAWASEARDHIRALEATR